MTLHAKTAMSDSQRQPYSLKALSDQAYIRTHGL